MRALLTCFVLAAALGLAAEASAQDPWWQDQIGLISSEDPYQNCDYSCVGYGTASLILQNPTCPYGVAGWECRLDNDGDAVITSVTYGLGIDADSDFLGFAVGLAEVLPYSSLIVLAEVEYVSFGGTGELYIYPNRTPSIPDAAVYVDGSDPLHQIQAYPMTQAWTTPAFTVNWCICLPAAESSWGEVKALFR